MARTITLVLLGGGVVLGGASMLAPPGNAGRQRQCQDARAANRPDAEQICASARSSTSAGGAWFVGRGATGSGPALAGGNGFRTAAGVSSRGGFGSIARGFSSSGG